MRSPHKILIVFRYKQVIYSSPEQVNLPTFEVNGTDAVAADYPQTWGIQEATALVLVNLPAQDKQALITCTDRS
jgi:hypothetical protein